MDRRRYLRLSTVGLAAAVAGCGQGLGIGSGDGDDGGADADSSTSGDSEDGTGTAGTSADGGTATAEPTPTPTATPERGVTVGDVETPTPSSTATPRPVAQVVAVADGGLSFEPETFEISAGETVVWVWHNTGHNVVPAARPQESDWRGTPGGDDELYDVGYEYSHTFDVPGEYEYYCQPHRDYGMAGSFRVTD